MFLDHLKLMRTIQGHGIPRYSVLSQNTRWVAGTPTVVHSLTHWLMQQISSSLVILDHFPLNICILKPKDKNFVHHLNGMCHWFFWSALAKMSYFYCLLIKLAKFFRDWEPKMDVVGLVKIWALYLHYEELCEDVEKITSFAHQALVPEILANM